MTATAGRQSSHPYINSRLKLRLKLIATTGYRFDNTIISKSFTNLNLPAGNITNKDIIRYILFVHGYRHPVAFLKTVYKPYLLKLILI